MYYHGSNNSDLKLLKLSHSEDNKVYVTSNKLVALVYASREYINLFSMNKETKCVKFFEYKPNLFKTLYKGKVGYIYIVEDKEYKKVEQSDKCSMLDAYCINEDVKIMDLIKIDDVYEELKKYEKSGEFQLIKYEDMDEKSISVIKFNLKKVIEKNKNNSDFYSYIIKYFSDLLD